MGLDQEAAEGYAEDMRSSPSVSVVIPVLNEASTIERIVRRIGRSPRVLEVIVVDDGSVDGSGEIAARAGARVLMSTLLGKGASLEDGIAAASGDVVLCLDGDLEQVGDDFVEQMTAPVVRGEADVVKAGFDRTPGQVALLTARPLLSAFFPELARLEQPLTGIVAARRSLLQNLCLENDYGADVGLLIDAVMKGARVLEVDIGQVDHSSETLEALEDVAMQVTRVILDRAWRYERLSINFVRDMEESERLSRAERLSAAPESAFDRDRRRLALFQMDGVLLDGRFAVELAKRVEAMDELLPLLDNRILPEEERERAIAAVFTGVHVEVFEEIARSMPLSPGAVETVVGLRKAGYVVGVLSDSFQIAAEIVRRRVFADFSVASFTRFHHRMCTGHLTPAPTMVDSDGCQRHRYCASNVVRYLEQRVGVVPGLSLAVGSGETDICVLEQVGLPIAFRPRSTAVGEAAAYTVERSLVEVLELAGVARSPAGRSGGTRISPGATRPGDKRGMLLRSTVGEPAS